MTLLLSEQQCFCSILNSWGKRAGIYKTKISTSCLKGEARRYYRDYETEYLDSSVCSASAPI